MKRLSVLSVLIFLLFLLSILSVYHYQPKIIIFQEDSLIFDIVDNNLAFLACYVCQVPLIWQFITRIIKPKDFSKPLILTYNSNTRSPPA